MSEMFFRKLNETDWHLINAWKEALIRLLDERRIDDHVAWRLVSWLEDLTDIARQEGLFNPARVVEHDQVECLRVTERMTAMYSYSMTTGHYSLASAISTLMAAMQAGILPIYNTYCQIFISDVLRRAGLIDPSTSDDGQLGGPLSGVMQARHGLAILGVGPAAFEPVITRDHYLVSGPAYINYDLIALAEARMRQVVSCARDYVAGTASRFDLNALVEDDLYTAGGLDSDMLFLQPLFSEDASHWLGDFFTFWNTRAAGFGDSFARTNPDDPERLIMFARRPVNGQPPGDGWRLLHTARLLGLWPLFGLR